MDQAIIDLILKDERIGRIARLTDQSHHWWLESMRASADRDVARANAALAWAFLQAEMRATSL